ncbi:hypothetical protein [Viscerimonas tarda]
MKMNYFSRIASILFFSLLVTSLSAKDIYLSATGDDDNDGLTPSTPVASMSRVLGNSALGITPVMTNGTGDVVHISGIIDLTQDPYYLASTTVANDKLNGFLFPVNTYNNSKFSFVGDDKATSGFDGKNAARFGKEWAGIPQTVTFKNLTFKNLGTSTIPGGSAIRIVNNYNISSNIIINNCVFTGCLGTQGTLNLYRSRVEVIDTEFSGNVITEGSAIFFGGGLLGDDCSVTVDGCTVINNDASTVGTSGAFKFNASAIDNVTIKNTLIKGNKIKTTGAYGGAIHVQNSTGNIVVDSCVIEENSANTGGAIRFYGTNGKFTIKNSTISANEAPGGGGAIATYNATGEIIVENCTVKNHTNGGWGAAFDIFNGGNGGSGNPTVFTIKSSLITGNQCPTNGHASALRLSSDGNTDGSRPTVLSIINSTVYKNIHPGNGVGALWIRSTCPGSEFNLINSTVVENEVNGAVGQGAGLRFNGAAGDLMSASINTKIRIYNSIIQGNTGTAGDTNLNSDVYFTIPQDEIATDSEIRNSYIGRILGGQYTANQLSYNNVLNYSADIATNGPGLPIPGATAIATYGAIPLEAGAPGLTAGDATYLQALGISTDQLGFTRNFVGGKCAVGAVELDYTTVDVKEVTVAAAEELSLTQQGAALLLTSPVKGLAKLDIFSISGSLVKSYAPQLVEAGAATAYASGLPQGLYIAKANVGGKVYSVKIAIK